MSARQRTCPAASRHSQFRNALYNRVDLYRGSSLRRPPAPHARQRRRARYSLPQRNNQIRCQFARVPNRKTDVSASSPFHQQQNAKNLVINMFLDQRGGTREHFVQIQRCIDLFPICARVARTSLIISDCACRGRTARLVLVRVH